MITTDDQFGAVTCTIDMCFGAENVESAIELMKSGVECTAAKPGCNGCAVTQDVGDRSHIRYSAEWASEACLSRHLQSEEFRRILLAMDMCVKEPLVRIGNMQGHRGLAYLSELRDGSTVVED